MKSGISITFKRVCTSFVVLYVPGTYAQIYEYVEFIFLFYLVLAASNTSIIFDPQSDLNLSLECFI